MRWALVVPVAAMPGSGACERTRRPPTQPGPSQPSSAAPSVSSARTAAFWVWFQNNAAALRAQKDRQHTMETIGAELERVHPGLVAEIGELRDSLELVISADGNLELFPVVQEI